MNSTPEHLVVPDTPDRLVVPDTPDCLIVLETPEHQTRSNFVDNYSDTNISRRKRLFGVSSLDVRKSKKQQNKQDVKIGDVKYGTVDSLDFTTYSKKQSITESFITSESSTPQSDCSHDTSITPTEQARIRKLVREWVFNHMLSEDLQKRLKSPDALAYDDWHKK